ncbi:MAG: cupredoxin domain-containing protein [Nitrososphaerales archaeon]|nr:cupredoxin domain-containing protein [Nitrososphaerales archaeon]
MQMEPEHSEGAPRGLLPALGVIMLIVGVAIASLFIFRLQPPYAPPAIQVTTQQGVATIMMPAGVGASSSLNFSPANATIVVGVNNTVVWTNEDTASHTVVSRSVPSGAQPFQSGVMAKGDTFNVTLTVPGVYTYYCSIHPAWMKATIVVKSGAAAPSGPTIVIPDGVGSSQNLNFSPQALTVVIGVNNTVTWVNQDGVVHTATAIDQSFNSGNIQPGGSWSHTFATPGSYSYVCVYHGWMKGTIIVKAGP